MTTATFCRYNIGYRREFLQLKRIQYRVKVRDIMHERTSNEFIKEEVLINGWGGVKMLNSVFAAFLVVKKITL